MNYKMMGRFLAQILFIEAFFMLPALGISLYCGETMAVKGFLIAIAVALATAVILFRICRGAPSAFYAKEGFVIVALSWIALSVFGALPFFFSGAIPNFIDALFETVSGFTTTGASILSDVEALSYCSLLWRSFTHWIGGMGVLVFVMAIIPSLCDRSIYIMKAEMPGPIVGKLVPKVRSTATILYLIYVGMTVIQVILLLCGGMSLFDSLIHTFGTAGTGGFGIKADSIGSYSSYLQWVITVFMILFGINFNLYYLILIKKAKVALSSGELWCYLGIVLTSIVVISFNISLPLAIIFIFNTPAKLSLF